MRIAITNIDDPRLDAYRDLKARSANQESMFIAEGAYLVERLAASRYPLQSIVTSNTTAAQIPSLVDDQVPVYCLSIESVRALVGYDFHRGMLACGQRLPGPAPNTALKDLLVDAAQPVTLVLLPRIYDPANFGGILRLSAAFGVSAVLLGPNCTDHLNRRVLRTSMGSALTVPIIRVPDMLQTVRDLQQDHDIEVAATVLDPSAQSLPTVKRAGRFAIAFGSEGDGLPSEFIAACDRALTIPMQTGTDSLNVTVAAGIFLHYLQPEFR